MSEQRTTTVGTEAADQSSFVIFLTRFGFFEWLIVGGVILIVVLVILTLCIWCCCFRKQNKKTRKELNQPVFIDDVDSPDSEPNDIEIEQIEPEPPVAAPPKRESTILGSPLSNKPVAKRYLDLEKHDMDRIYSYTFSTKPFGMEWSTIRGDKSNLYVSKVRALSQASKANIQMGSRLIAFNGEDIENLGAHNIHGKLTISELPVTVTFLRPPQTNVFTSSTAAAAIDTSSMAAVSASEGHDDNAYDGQRRRSTRTNETAAVAEAAATTAPRTSDVLITVHDENGNANQAQSSRPKKTAVPAASKWQKFLRSDSANDDHDMLNANISKQDTITDDPFNDDPFSDDMGPPVLLDGGNAEVHGTNEEEIESASENESEQEQEISQKPKAASASLQVLHASHEPKQSEFSAITLAKPSFLSNATALIPEVFDENDQDESQKDS